MWFIGLWLGYRSTKTINNFTILKTCEKYFNVFHAGVLCKLLDFSQGNGCLLQNFRSHLGRSGSPSACVFISSHGPHSPLELAVGAQLRWNRERLHRKQMPRLWGWAMSAVPGGPKDHFCSWMNCGKSFCCPLVCVCVCVCLCEKWGTSFPRSFSALRLQQFVFFGFHMFGFQTHNCLHVRHACRLAWTPFARAVVVSNASCAGKMPRPSSPAVLNRSWPPWPRTWRCARQRHLRIHVRVCTLDEQLSCYWAVTDHIKTHQTMADGLNWVQSCHVLLVNHRQLTSLFGEKHWALWRCHPMVGWWFQLMVRNSKAPTETTSKPGHNLCCKMFTRYA